MDPHRRARQELVKELLGRRGADGAWRGRLADSALATAVAITALHLQDPVRHAESIRRGVAWLRGDQQGDGGWGDTPESPSALPTSFLVGNTLHLLGSPPSDPTRVRGEAYLRAHAGTTASERMRAVQQIYGKDRTFAVPILCHGAVAGVFPWREIPPLPYELALLPRVLYKHLRLEVVSYALPALITMGILLRRRQAGLGVRELFAPASLRFLIRLQPASGGFLEAIPLTGFVTMALIGAGEGRHPVIPPAIQFLCARQRENGAWPIDSDLAVWLTAQATIALECAGVAPAPATVEWLLGSQWRALHPYTGAAPGGWGWTDLPGAVPDADDTAAVLRALHGTHPAEAAAGRRWLASLQNGDGGMPTFCRGWQRLPFDQSTPEITAHALLAGALDAPAQRAALRYLERSQEPNGGWIPLWFGHPRSKDQKNPVYGTARVLEALKTLGLASTAMAERGRTFLLVAQNDDGGWGGDKGVESSWEETAVALTALTPSGTVIERADPQLQRGFAYLLEQLQARPKPTPIGLYFAKLWYHEALYPLLWSLEALTKLG